MCVLGSVNNIPTGDANQNVFEELTAIHILSTDKPVIYNSRLASMIWMDLSGRFVMANNFI